MWRKCNVKSFLSLLAISAMVGSASADVSLPALFSDHMVLQRDQDIPVWGWADAGEKVTVTIGDEVKKTTTNKAGEWKVELDEMEAGGPFVLKIEGNNTIKHKDVLVGEVWLCSGQSNMAMAVRGCKDFDKEKAAANLPNIRMLTVERTPAETPQKNVKAQWAVCSPETVGAFSATAYFFGRKIHNELDVPVGLINSSWGGTPVQAWTSLDDQKSEPKLKPLLDDWEKKVAEFDPEKAQAANEKKLADWKKRAAKAKAAKKSAPRKPRATVSPVLSQHRPANLYNGMIAPLAPYAIRGAIWYQGESNAGNYDAKLYGMQLAMMIENWRDLWGQNHLCRTLLGRGDFPFLWVQLPNFRAPQTKPSEPTGWVTVQEEMLKTLAVANTGMAVTIDIGMEKNIHPTNKQDVGKRLALWALGATYGKDVVQCGPLYKSMRERFGKIVIQFDHVGEGLAAKNGEKLKGFAIAGADKKFVWAEAEIRGNKVVVSSPEVKEPVAVRFAWAENPAHNLFNKAGLPASPFRTDEWEQ